ncbi:hypothetical protein DKK70_05185 [Gilliamella apicola]|uniref:Uncharacterized protein n=1 Tax=Gilliamella apicola TaxID=1196095 RepID=A0A2V4E5X1_9GAMM|nr:hypothetical protein [Gilliamella apicola]PXZ07249.1 hypothetical protein DKK70_05185 [Gilliamella apicola]
MYKYMVVTPTFVEHFGFIKNYLKSADKYLIDKSNITFAFIISKIESYEFKKIVKLFPDLNILTLNFEDILEHYNVNKEPEELIHKYGKFSFQTLKKLYAMMYLDAEKFLILDSESMFINPTNLAELFDNYYKNPVLMGSILKNRLKTCDLLEAVLKTTDMLTSFKSDKFFLENFMWFYDKQILNDLFNELGSPINLIEKNYKFCIRKHLMQAVFEITLYQNYIYKNNDKYNYHIINVDEEVEKNLGTEQSEKYVNKFAHKRHGGGGLIEYTSQLLTKRNVAGMSQLFKNLEINIMRCECTTASNYALQKQFISYIKPNILAASQFHLFGINNTVKNKFRVIFLESSNFLMLKRNLSLFFKPISIVLRPFTNIYKWFIKPIVLVIVYSLVSLYGLLKKFKLIFSD